jgi:NAD(P)-dependent dehydrogenase (short-subunit alcohol dehydrogenase family)
LKRTAIITGACGAIGRAIAMGLANNGYKIYITSRSRDKAQRTAQEISRQIQNAEVIPVGLDLGLSSEISAFAAQWTSPLHLLINNAAIAPKKRTLTTEGIEMQWAVNVLGYDRMIRAFHPHMRNLEDARIVNVASYYAGHFDVDDPEFRTRPYDNDTAYQQSKQADRMLTKLWAEELTTQGITVNACHPGDVNSTISNAMGFGGHETPEEGAATPLWLALSSDLAKRTGCYAEHKRIIKDPFIQNQQAMTSLDDLLRRYQEV